MTSAPSEATPPRPDGFAAAAGNLRKLVALGAAACAPIVAAFAGLAPPWPAGVGKISVLLLTVLLAVLWPLAGAATGRHVRRAALVGIVGLLVFLALSSVFTFAVPTRAHVVVVLGCGWSDNARRVLALSHADPGWGCPGDYDLLLRGAVYEPGAIWTAASILAVKLALFASWLTALGGLAAALFLFGAGRAIPDVASEPKPTGGTT